MPTTPYARWREARRADARALVAFALRAHPEAPALVLARCAGVSIGRLYVALAELEVSGEVTARWADGPSPRRRLYRLADR